MFLIIFSFPILFLIATDNQYSLALTNDITSVSKNTSNTNITPLTAATNPTNIINTSTASSPATISTIPTSTITAKELGDIAKQIYNEKILSLGNEIKNVIITIPDEAHESPHQPKNQLPLTDQPYLPQNLTIHTGTNVVWFNADVDHEHKLQSYENMSSLQFSNPILKYNTPSESIAFDKAGILHYYSIGVNKNGPTFMMNGKIDVEDNPSNVNIIKSNPKADTVGVYMIPYMLLDKYLNEFKNEGITVDSYYTYHDLRGGQKGTGPEQTILVWSSSGITLQNILSSLEKITPTLPYS